MELIEIVKPFIDSEDTCDAVIEYLKMETNLKDHMLI